MQTRALPDEKRNYQATAFTNGYEFSKGGYELPHYPFVAPPCPSSTPAVQRKIGRAHV